MQATPEQYEAIHTHDKNLIVVAGAGSGKTRVLVERYLELLASHKDWHISALVAITFTREAAHEMRHRLRLELERRAKEADADLWARHLAGMDSARIDTIHGLCADIIRANAAQAGVDPLFEVLDETEAGILLEEAVDDALAEVERPVATLFAYNDALKIEGALKQMSLIHADYPAPGDDAEAVFAGWLRDWEELVFSEREKLLGSAEAQALDAIDVPAVPDKLADLAAQYRDYLRRASMASEAAHAVELLESCQARGAVGNKGSAKAWGGKEEKAEVANALRELRDRIRAALKTIGEMPGELDRLAARLLPLWHALLQSVAQRYCQRKRAAAQLDFDDLERLAADLLRDQAVRARYINAEFKHLLVDEFQDTNAAQWQIIRSLVDLQTGGSLFVVGDPKQSIYQFRGADISVFSRVARQLGETPAGRELPLSISFRSHPNLIAMYNVLFARLFEQDATSPVADYQAPFGAPMQAARVESPDLPVIELQLLDKARLDDVDSQRQPAHDMRRWEADEIAERVMNLASCGRPVFDKATSRWRPIEYGDIAILFQSMSHVTIYEDALKARQLPYITVAGRGYYDRQEVWDMLELLRFLHNPANDLALATVLRSPLFSFSDDLLLTLRLLPARESCAAGRMPLWQALHSAADAPVPGLVAEDRPRLQYALETLGELRRISGRVAISDLLRRALTMTNYAAVLTGLPDGDRRRGNVEKLLQLAQNSGKISLGKFSQYLSDLTAREAREGEAPLEAGDAIRLMTAHASKGLEFPLVILADASWERGWAGAPALLADAENGLSCQVYDAASNKDVNRFAHRRSHELQKLKESEERKRLLYVAATRAQDYLIISGQARQNRQGFWTSGGWLKQLIGILGLESLESKPEQSRSIAGLPISIVMPSPAPEGWGQQADFAQDLWDWQPDQRQFPPYAPPLMEPLPRRESPLPSHITVSQIADIGAYRHASSQSQRQESASRLLQSLRRGAPAEPDPVSQSQAPKARTIGAIVHELLRYPDVELDAPAADRLIAAVAWERGLTNTERVQAAIREVKRLLELTRTSQVQAWIASAREDSRPIYRELPFMYRSDKRVIHGVMDVVLQQKTGEWVIIDYKTSAVDDGAYEDHARRYLLQLGVYAAALRAKLNLAGLPETYVHYIRGNRTVKLDSRACQAELRSLEATIGDITNHDS